MRRLTASSVFGVKSKVLMNTTTPFDADQARGRVEAKIALIGPLKDSDVARVPDLEIAGFYVFSVMPHSVGKAGEVLYMVSPGEMLTAGTPADFDLLMSKVEAGKKPNVLDLKTFVRLFLRLRVLRHGDVLERPDAHPLLRRGHLAADKFTLPRYDFDSSGARYVFWVFDTDRMEPIMWDVRVAPSGKTTFSSSEAS